MKVIVTGASGYLGTHLCKMLKTSGHEVLALTRKPSPALVKMGVTCFAGAENWRKAFQQKPDTVCNLAGAFTPHFGSGPSSIYESNFAFPQTILKMALEFGAQNWIQVGTFWQYDPEGRPCPSNGYAALKQVFMEELELVSQMKPLKVISLILYDVYGPEDWRQKLVPALIQETLKTNRDRFPLTEGKQIVSFVYLEDVLSSFEGALERVVKPGPKMETFFVHNEHQTLREFVETLQTVSGNPLDIEWGARSYDHNHIMKPYFGPRLPGWTPKVSFAEGVKRILNERR